MEAITKNVYRTVNEHRIHVTNGCDGIRKKWVGIEVEGMADLLSNNMSQYPLTC